MNVNFLVVPQWQGSGSSRALRLSDGAEAIRGDLPAASTTVIDVPLGAGESLGTGVCRISAIHTVRDRVAEALNSLAEPVVTIGGDCGVELAPVSHAHAVHPDDLAVLWLDAHADANSPDSSPTGAFHGMVLRSLLGDGPASLVPDNPIPAEKIILAGTRALDEKEAEWVGESKIRLLSQDELSPQTLVAALEATGASAAYLHIDLDVLDPAEFSSLGYPEPFGVSVSTLLDSIRAVARHCEIVGAGICEFAPSDSESAADDLSTILRIIGALTA